MNIPLPSAYQDLEPASVWRAFALLNATPRPSGQEEALRTAIESLADARGVSHTRDERGNLVVRVPSKNAAPDAPTVAIQAHLDMVCQKTPDTPFDFERDAIIPRREGDHVYATGTTLGADNGIGVAFMLALLEGDAPTHPPLELLFTVEEESGLYGAALLDPALVSARRLINLDSEEDDEITIGCAGGAGVTLHLPIKREPLQGDGKLYRVSVSGLAGGHSGIQIGEKLGNALKMTGQLLDALPEMRLVALDGGTAHNAIPRDCVAIVAVPTPGGESLEAAVARVAAPLTRAAVARVAAPLTRAADALTSHWLADEPGLTIQVANERGDMAAPMSPAATRQVLSLIRDLPHGVQTMSARWEGKVQTSSNLAQVATSAGEVEMHVSNRSFVAGDIARMQAKCREMGEAAGARIEERDGYPGWEPRADSPLRDQTAAAFANVSGHLPRVEVVHAGLECGLLSEKLPGLDAVSFGPTIRGAHTPAEWVSIPSVARNWAILRELLRALAG